MPQEYDGQACFNFIAFVIGQTFKPFSVKQDKCVNLDINFQPAPQKIKFKAAKKFRFLFRPKDINIKFHGWKIITVDQQIKTEKK